MKLQPKILNTSNKRDSRNRLADGWAWDNAVVVFDKEERRGTKKKKVLPGVAPF